MSEQQPQSEQKEQDSQNKDAKPEVTAEEQAALDASLAVAKQLEEQEAVAAGDTEMKDESQPTATEEEKQKEPEGESIGKYVNQQYAKTLQEMGFSQIVSEKALFMTQQSGATVEAAMQWIDANSEAPDFEEELKIVGQDGEEEIKKASRWAGMSKEEKEIKMKELQQQVRSKKAAEERKLTKDQEIMRIKATKEAQEVERQLKEVEVVRQYAQQKRDRDEVAREKAKMLEQLRRDKEERFGKGAAGTEGPAAVVKKEKSGIDKVNHGIKMTKTIYTEARQPGVAKTCFKTCMIYLGNTLKDPSNEKFQRINLANEAFQKRVGKINGGLDILKGAGFVEQSDGTILMENIDEMIIKETIRILENNQ